MLGSCQYVGSLRRCQSISASLGKQHRNGGLSRCCTTFVSVNGGNHGVSTRVWLWSGCWMWLWSRFLRFSLMLFLCTSMMEHPQAHSHTLCNPHRLGHS